MEEFHRRSGSFLRNLGDCDICLFFSIRRQAALLYFTVGSAIGPIDGGWNPQVAAGILSRASRFALCRMVCGRDGCAVDLARLEQSIRPRFVLAFSFP